MSVIITVAAPSLTTCELAYEWIIGTTGSSPSGVLSPQALQDALELSDSRHDMLSFLQRYGLLRSCDVHPKNLPGAIDVALESISEGDHERDFALRCFDFKKALEKFQRTAVMNAQPMDFESREFAEEYGAPSPFSAVSRAFASTGKLWTATVLDDGDRLVHAVQTPDVLTGLYAHLFFNPPQQATFNRCECGRRFLRRPKQRFCSLRCGNRVRQERLRQKRLGMATT